MFDSLQKLLGQSYHARLALLLTLAQAVIICALEAVVFTMHLKRVGVIEDTLENQHNSTNQTQNQSQSQILPNARSMSVYHVLFMLAHIFTFVLCVDALYHENTIQLIALALFTVATFSYSVIQTYQSVTLLDQTDIHNLPTPDEIPFEGAIIILMFCIAITFAYLSYKLYQEFGWSIYKRIGADTAMRDRYKMYQIYIMLLKFDIFFLVGFTAQFLVLTIVKGEKVYGTVITTTLVSIIMLSVAFWGVQTERKILTCLFMLGCVGTEGYIIYKIVDVIHNPQDYMGTRIFVTFFLFASFILGVVTFVIAALCMRNFGQGLKFHISRRTFTTASSEDVSASDHPGYVLENVHRPTKRWSID